MRREDRSSIASHPLADLGWKLLELSLKVGDGGYC
jgi:hypothetical protein